MVLSDRDVDAEHAPIPALLATAAVHSHLVREGARTMCGLVVESGEPRETMHVALLLGYGAAAVCPYLALEAARRPSSSCRYLKAVGDGLLKICSKMGISTIQSYRGAQIFEAVGLGPRLIDRYFPGTVSRVGGIEIGRRRTHGSAAHATGAFARRPWQDRPRRRVPTAARAASTTLESRVDRGACSAPSATADAEQLRARSPTAVDGDGSTATSAACSSRAGLRPPRAARRSRAGDRRSCAGSPPAR